jgi:hypothetical protein
MTAPPAAAAMAGEAAPHATVATAMAGTTAPAGEPA